MTKPRKKPNARFHAFIVEPSPDFEPTNWQQTPQHYRIVRYIGPKDFRGPADAWKFLYNHEVLRRGDPTRWAICLDFEAPIINQLNSDRFNSDQLNSDQLNSDQLNSDQLNSDRFSNRLGAGEHHRLVVDSKRLAQKISGLS